MTNKKECGCCMKKSYNVSKCFVNKNCSWKSCASCITKQLSMEKELSTYYKCPNCRQESIYRKHSRFTKWLNQNRTALKKVVYLQSKLIRVYDDRIKNMNYLSNTTVLFQVFNGEDEDEIDYEEDIGGNWVEPTTENEINPDLIPHDLAIDDIDISSHHSSSVSSSSL